MGFADDAVDEGAGFDHRFQDLQFLIAVETVGEVQSTKPAKKPGGQGVGSPVANAGHDLMVAGNSARDQPASGDVPSNHLPSDFTHADLVATVADAKGDLAYFLTEVKYGPGKYCAFLSECKKMRGYSYARDLYKATSKGFELVSSSKKNSPVDVGVDKLIPLNLD